MNNLYNEKSIESLSPLEFTRLRPQVYAGDCTYSTQLLIEIFSNAVDEFRLGHGDTIDIVVNGATVALMDHGQGFIPNSFRDDGKTILEMRELAKSVPVVDDVLRYAMNLVSNTHPEIKNTSETAKKYIKYGASPRAGQALITAAKVRALINGNYNVSLEDIDALAYPVLRHRIKINYDAISEHLDADDIITLLIKENKKNKR